MARLENRGRADCPSAKKDDRLEKSLRRGRDLAVAIGALGSIAAAWSLFESQWVELNEVDVPIERLPPELDGFRILHLSDFHLGTLSLNGRAVAKAVAWAGSRGQAPDHGPAGRGSGANADHAGDSDEESVGSAVTRMSSRAGLRGQAPGHGPEGQIGPEVDLVAITGDLLSRRRGRDALIAALAELRAEHGVYAVLGNHDVAETRDPFAEASGLTRLPHATLLLDESRIVEARGRRIQVVGVEPRGFAARRSQPQDHVDPKADLTILLCHFPDITRWLPPKTFDLILAGHLHGGQICLPSPWGKVHLEHLRAAHWQGLQRTAAGMLYVSRGLGTSFVPFRFLARPEVTVLTLRAPRTAM